MDTTQLTELKFDVLYWQREGRPFVAQCLQYDVAAQAPTLEELKKRFSRTIVTYFMERTKVAVAQAAPDSPVDKDARVQNVVKTVFALDPAPRRYWDLAAAGFADSEDLPMYVPSTGSAIRANFRHTKQLPSEAVSASCM